MCVYISFTTEIDELNIENKFSVVLIVCPPGTSVIRFTTLDKYVTSAAYKQRSGNLSEVNGFAK